MAAEKTESDILCEKLSGKFADRGVKNINVRNRVAARNAFVKRQKEAEAEREELERKRAADIRRKRAESAEARKHPEPFSSKMGRGEEIHLPCDGKFGYAFERGTRIRDGVKGFNPDRYELYRDIKPDGRIELVEKKSILSSLKTRIMSFFGDRVVGEKEVKGRRIPVGAIAVLVMCTLLLMVVLRSFDTYSRTSAEVKELEKQQTALVDENERLVNLINARDNLEEIERVAVNDLGMVSSDYVETHYMTVTGGERNEVIRNTEGGEDAEGLFATLLSAWGGGFETILDYID